jgi:hypothetical protein
MVKLHLFLSDQRDAVLHFLVSWNMPKHGKSINNVASTLNICASAHVARSIPSVRLLNLKQRSPVEFWLGGCRYVQGSAQRRQRLVLRAGLRTPGSYAGIASFINKGGISLHNEILSNKAIQSVLRYVGFLYIL